MIFKTLVFHNIYFYVVSLEAMLFLSGAAGVGKSQKCILVHRQVVLKKTLVRTNALLVRIFIKTFASIST